MKRAFAIAVGITLFWATASVAFAKSELFEITYSGSGTLKSSTEAITSPQCAQGSATFERFESTGFSWFDGWHVSLSVSSHGAGSASAKVEATTTPGSDNSSTVSFSATAAGCQSASASCTGESQPQPGQSSVLAIAGAGAGGSTRFKLQAVGGFLGWQATGFSGTWADPDSMLGGPTSCDEEFTDVPTLLDPVFAPPSQTEASFPVKVATLKSLPVGHYFKVKISPGHYAPSIPSYDCQQNDGCENLSWNFDGTVRVTRRS